MVSYALIVIMKFGLATASHEAIVIDGFKNRSDCEIAAEQVKSDGGYKRHMCIEVKK